MTLKLVVFIQLFLSLLSLVPHRSRSTLKVKLGELCCVEVYASANKAKSNLQFNMSHIALSYLRHVPDKPIESRAIFFISKETFVLTHS